MTLAASACPACQRVAVPAEPQCPACGTRTGPHELPAEGVVLAWTRTQATHAVVLVGLADAARVLARWYDAATPRIGQAVSIRENGPDLDASPGEHEVG